MRFKNLFWYLFVVANFSECTNISTLVSTQCPNKKSPLHLVRKRRHLVFPDKAAVVLTLSLVKTIMVHAPSGWNVVLEIDVVYKLPDAKHLNSKYRKKLHHRQKRDLWEQLAEAFLIQNMNGHSCVMRAVCEARTHLAPPGVSLVHDILRSIFTYPIDDSEFLQEIGHNYNALNDDSYCKNEFMLNTCPVSILHFVLFLNKS